MDTITIMVKRQGKASPNAGGVGRGEVVVNRAIVGPALLVLLLVVAIGCSPPREPPKAAPEKDSSTLSHSVVVDSLDAPFPAGKSVIWCSSFQVAWNRMKDDVIKEPPRIRGAEEICDRLNRGTASEADLPPGSFYAAAGLTQDGIVDRIVKEMAEKFPVVPPPDLEAEDLAFVAYAYLEAGVKFTLPFFESREPLSFVASGGTETAVASFGLLPEHEYAYYGLREQVRILFTTWLEADPGGLDEFAIDPCRDSSPSQIILARVTPRGSLAETIADVESRIAAAKGEASELGPNDTFQVPNVLFRVRHHFRELEGKERPFLNSGFESAWISQALQVIQFRLDRSGAELKSEAKMLCKPIPSDFLFDRPFLVYMKLRGGGRPFFALWVEDAELLARW